MKKGISLIVLSITILVMAILAATVIISLEDSGIIGRSKKAVNSSNFADEYTRLTVIKNGILTDNLGTITVEEYINELQNRGLIETDIITNGDGSKTITTKTGFEVTISQNISNDLSIELENENNNSSSNDTAKTLITFTINGVEYQAEEGMTWQDWIDSGDASAVEFNYDTIQVYHSSGYYVAYTRNGVIGNVVNKTYVIEATTYALTRVGGGLGD